LGVLRAFFWKAWSTYRFRELRYVDHPESDTLADPDFVHAEPDRGHRLPVRRLLPGLDALKLLARFMLRGVRKLPDTLEAVAQSIDALHG